MPVEELCDYVRSRLPLRSRLVGRERINDLVMIAVTEWPSDWLMQCGRSSPEEEKAVADTAARVSRTYEAVRGEEPQYGFFWAFVLSAVVSAIVQHILEWWLMRSAHRVKMAGWQEEMRSGR